MNNKCYYVYILAKARNSTFYTGVTNDLIRRVYEHKHDLADGFTKKYGIKTLVYYEQHETIEAAICREKLIKKWKREYKLNIIESLNPDWQDLYGDLINPVVFNPAEQQLLVGADAPLPDPAMRRGDKLVEQSYG